MVGHNRKKGYKGSVAKELVGVSEFERSNAIVAKGQLARRSNHTTSINKVAELGRHKEKGPQLPK